MPEDTPEIEKKSFGLDLDPDKLAISLLTTAASWLIGAVIKSSYTKLIIDTRSVTDSDD